MRTTVFGGPDHVAEAESDAEVFAESCRRLGWTEAVMPSEGLGRPQGQALSCLVSESYVVGPAERTESFLSFASSVCCGWW